MFFGFVINIDIWHPLVQQRLWFSLKFAKRCSDPLFWYSIVIPKSLGLFMVWFVSLGQVGWKTPYEYNQDELGVNASVNPRFLTNVLALFMFLRFVSMMYTCLSKIIKRTNDELRIQVCSPNINHEPFQTLPLDVSNDLYVQILHSWELTAQAPEHRPKPKRNLVFQSTLGAQLAGCSPAMCCEECDVYLNRMYDPPDFVGDM